MSVILAVTSDTQSGDWTTVGATGDLIYIGADEPFWGLYAEMLNLHTGAALPFTTVAYSDGAAGWPTMPCKDSTLSFTIDGCIAFLPTADPVPAGVSNRWVKETVNSSEKYWIRLDPSAVLTSTKVANVYICPYRPAIDETNFPFSAQKLAGVLPTIFTGTWRGDQLIWQDTWTLESARVMQLVLGRTRGSASTGLSTLWAICGDNIYHMATGPQDAVVRAAWPATSGGTKLLQASGADFGLPVNIKSVQKLIVHGEYLQEDDGLFIYYRWDNDDRWYPSGPHTPFPVVVGPLEGQGRVLYVTYGLLDASRDALAPYVSHIEIAEGDWTDEGPTHAAIGQDISSPQEL